MPEILSAGAAYLALAAVLTLVVIASAQIIAPGIGFWPPPDPKSWQSRLFRALFRVVVYGLLIATAFWLWDHAATVPFSLIIPSVFVFLIGFGIALAATDALGWGNAFGAQDGLRTDGIFRWSRNPIYLATFLGLLGWGLLIDDNVIRFSLFLWALLYVVGVFLEERWLTERYGQAYVAYCKKVRRFI